MPVISQSSHKITAMLLCCWCTVMRVKLFTLNDKVLLHMYRIPQPPLGYDQTLRTIS